MAREQGNKIVRCNISFSVSKIKKKKNSCNILLQNPAHEPYHCMSGFERDARDASRLGWAVCGRCASTVDAHRHWTHHARTMLRTTEPFSNPLLGPPHPVEVGVPPRAHTTLANLQALKSPYVPSAVRVFLQMCVSRVDCGLTGAGPRGMVVWLKGWRRPWLQPYGCFTRGTTDHDYSVLYCSSGPLPVTDLNLDIHLSGRATRPLHAEVIRELTASDLALLSTERGVQPTHVQRITDRHHALARCLASGMSATEAGLCTGYTASRISVLRGDPAFEELIAFYRTDRGAQVLDYQQNAAIARNLATTILIDKMEAELQRDPTEPEIVSAGFALDAAKTFADRTGHGPQSKTTNLNVNVNLGDRMKAARERAASLSLPTPTGAREVSHEASLAPTIIDGIFTEVRK